jgi:uncharacterized protein DUF4242
MGFYLAERYVPSMTAADVGAAIDRLDRAVADEPVRHVLSVLVHGEDTCLSIFEAPDPRAIERVTVRAGFPLDRIVEATAYPGGRTGPQPGPPVSRAR